MRGHDIYINRCMSILNNHRSTNFVTELLIKHGPKEWSDICLVGFVSSRFDGVNPAHGWQMFIRQGRKDDRSRSTETRSTKVVHRYSSLWNRDISARV